MVVHTKNLIMYALYSRKLEVHVAPSPQCWKKIKKVVKSGNTIIPGIINTIIPGNTVQQRKLEVSMTHRKKFKFWGVPAGSANKIIYSLWYVEFFN